jgi:hypothetical protein
MPPKRPQKRKTLPAASKPPPTKVPLKRAQDNAKRLKQTPPTNAPVSFTCPNTLCGRAFPTSTGLTMHYHHHTICHKVVSAQKAQICYTLLNEKPKAFTNLDATTREQYKTPWEDPDDDDSEVAVEYTRFEDGE